VVSIDIAEEKLRRVLGEKARFRKHQWEAIDTIVNRKQKLLLVQKTGWGKSLVYFFSSFFLGQEKQGLTLLVSPLLSLMRNQLDMASRIGIRAETLNSSNPNQHSEIAQKIRTGQLDVLLVSPERLANQKFLSLVRGIEIQLLVVDEAHCISDWGHDFRPDYRRIVRIVRNLPAGCPVLATTATANDRVIEDIEEQLGPNLSTLRGSLSRGSLRLQNLEMEDAPKRMAWIAQTIPQLDGSGIVYCLTIATATRVAKWLRQNGIAAEAYHSQLASEIREQLEGKLLGNEVKVLVSTVALGMGFDKPDLGFVIHFQRPPSIVAYYQQIGRAGRSLDRAEIFLLSGNEDDDIAEYFIDHSFPDPRHLFQVLEATETEGGISFAELQERWNMKNSECKKCLTLLQVEGAVSHENARYFRTPNPWRPDTERWERVMEGKRRELEEMKRYVKHPGCLMEFITSSLNDPTSSPCGHCANCTGAFRSGQTDPSLEHQARQFLRREFVGIEPRKQFPVLLGGIQKRKIPVEMQAQPGYALGIYGDAGWGTKVKEGKYAQKQFGEELVEAVCDMINQKVLENGANPRLILSVPSLRRPELVPGFARKVSDKLGIPHLDCIQKKQDNPEQKTMQNSVLQFKNVWHAFSVNATFQGEDIILLDDLVDSRWTFTVITYQLKKKGAGQVFPIALSASWEGGNG